MGYKRSRVFDESDIELDHLFTVKEKDRMRSCCLISLFAYLFLGLYISNTLASNQKNTSSSKSSSKPSGSSSSSKPSGSSSSSKPSGSSSSGKPSGSSSSSKPSGSSSSGKPSGSSSKPSGSSSKPSESSSKIGRNGNKNISDIGNYLVNSIEERFDVKKLTFDDAEGSMNYIKDIFFQVLDDVDNKHNLDAKLRATFSDKPKQAFDKILESLAEIAKDEQVRNIVRDQQNVNAVRDVFENVQQKIKNKKR